MFEDVNTRAILDRVPARLNNEGARALWLRMNSEFESGGPAVVTSYLHSRFAEITQRLRDELAAAKNVDEG